MRQEITVTRTGPLVPFNIPAGPYVAEIAGTFTGRFTLESYANGAWSVLNDRTTAGQVPGTAAGSMVLMWRCHSINGEAVASIEGA